MKKRRNIEVFGGGDGRDRTVDLLNAIQALSQLSYAPEDTHILSQLFSKIKCL